MSYAGDVDDVHTSEALESSTPEITTLNVVSVSEEENIDDKISDEKKYLDLKGDPMRTQHILEVPVKSTEISTKMTVVKNLVEDVGAMVGIDAQNEIVHEAPNLHLSMLSSLVMPQYENTALTSHIMESNDAAKICDNSLEYRFQFGGGDDDEITYARTIVESLGGSVVADDSCTHLVLWKMTRTEKYLCACASGKVRNSIRTIIMFSVL